MLLQSLKVHSREVRFLGVAEFPIDLVGNQEEVVLEAELAQLYHFFLAEEFSGRVARVAD